MLKITKKTSKRDKLKAIIAERLASKHRLSKRNIYMIIAGDVENPEIFNEYMDGRERLVNAVAELIPFN